MGNFLMNRLNTLTPSVPSVSVIFGRTPFRRKEVLVTISEGKFPT